MSGIEAARHRVKSQFMIVTVILIWGVPTNVFNINDSILRNGVSLSLFPCKQSTMNVATGSTTVMRMPSAPTLSRDTAVLANRATWGTGPSAEVGLPPLAHCGRAATLPGLPVLLWQTKFTVLVAEHGQGSGSWFIR